jgi:hypothetical protein
MTGTSLQSGDSTQSRIRSLITQLPRPLRGEACKVDLALRTAASPPEILLLFEESLRLQVQALQPSKEGSRRAVATLTRVVNIGLPFGLTADEASRLLFRALGFGDETAGFRLVGDLREQTTGSRSNDRGSLLWVAEQPDPLLAPVPARIYAPVWARLYNWEAQAAPQIRSLIERLPEGLQSSALTCLDEIRE